MGRRVRGRLYPTALGQGAAASAADRLWPMLCTGLRCHGESFAPLWADDGDVSRRRFLPWKRQSIGPLPFVWLVFPG
jgi:hypothetical protein